MFKYKQGKENVVADALSRRYTIINTLSSKMLVFEFIRDLYASDSDFGNVYSVCEQVAFQTFYRHDGYLFRENKCCVPNCSMHDIFVLNHNVGV